MLKSKFPLSRSLGNDTGLVTKRLDAETFLHANRHAIMGQRHVNHPPIDHPYKCHKNTNHSHVSQLSKAPIPTSKLKYVPNLLQT